MGALRYARLNKSKQSGAASSCLTNQPNKAGLIGEERRDARTSEEGSVACYLVWWRWRWGKQSEQWEWEGRGFLALRAAETFSSLPRPSCHSTRTERHLHGWVGPIVFSGLGLQTSFKTGTHSSYRGERTGGQRAQTTTSTMERHPKDLTLLVRSTKPNPCFINNNNNNAVKPANTASDPNSCRC
jgi:hypothetical protein